MEQADDVEAIYKEFQSYDFGKSKTYGQTLSEVYNQYLIVLSDKDLEVKADLNNGVFNVERIPAEDREQLQLQTKIFVFCSETDHILEISDYQYWLAVNDPSSLKKITEATNDEVKLAEIEPTKHIDAAVNTMESTEYTSNYQEVVDMIVNNKPIAGIKQIPKTILDPSNASESTLAPRRKPWETTDSEILPEVDTSL